MVPGPGTLGGVHVETVLAGDVSGARAGGWRDQHQAVFGGEALGSALDHKGPFRGRQAVQAVEDRHGSPAAPGGV